MAKRKSRIGWRGRALAALALVALGAGAWQWWNYVHWAPLRSEFPVQGALIGGPEGEVNFHGLKAVGADFVYLEASTGSSGREVSFARNFALASGSGLQIGVVHHYDPCLPAEKQSANFVTIVPRDSHLLPPAIELDQLADDCRPHISDAEVESELTTFINQVEGHVGKSVLLKVSKRFEERYRIASRMERELWLERDRFQPDYGGRPWMLWTANSNYRSEAADGGIRWVVARQ